MENKTELTQIATSKRKSPTREALRHLWRHSSGRAGIIILGLLLLIAIFAPVIAPYDPTEILKESHKTLHTVYSPAGLPCRPTAAPFRR